MGLSTVGLASASALPAGRNPGQGGESVIDSGGMLHGGGAAAEAVESLERGCSSTQLTQSALRGASALTNLAAPSQAEVVKAYRLANVSETNVCVCLWE